MYAAQFRTKYLMIRDFVRHMLPKCARVVELQEMADLMHDDVILESLREECDFVVEAQVARTRAAPPPSFLCADGDTSVLHAKARGVVCRLRFDELSRALFILADVPFFGGNNHRILEFLLCALNPRTVPSKKTIDRAR